MLKSNQRRFLIAQQVAEGARDLVTKYLSAKFGSPEALTLDEQIRRLVRPGFYVHFKSSPCEPKFYQVFDVQGQVNYQVVSHAYQVSYAALYLPMRGRKGLRELLGADGFLTPVQKDGYIGPRFRYVGQHLRSNWYKTQ